MIKIFIVDDEFLIRMGMKMMEDWNSFGIEIVGEAANGVEALEKIKTTAPDIIITDLKMPVMDGIQLIRELKQSRFKGSIVVLSNYNDFELVREAMKLGAKEYLLKVTLTQEELVRVIDSVYKDMCNEVEKDQVNNMIRIELNDNRSIIKQRFINSLLNKNITEYDFKNKTDILNLKISEKIIQIACVIDDTYSEFTTDKSKDDGLLNYTIENIVDEIVNRKFAGEVFNIEKGKFLILLSCCNESSYSKLEEEQIIDLCNEIRVLTKRYVDVDASLFYSLDVVDISEIGQRTKILLDGIGMGFYSSQNRVLNVNQGQTLCFEIDNYFWKIKSDIKEALDLCDKTIFNILEDLFTHIEMKYYSISVIKRICANLVALLEDYVRREGGDAYNILHDRLLQFLEAPGTIAQLRKNVLLAFEQVLEYTKGLRENRLREDIVRAIEFIKRNYREKISLDDVANHVNMNKHYFCKLFKNETGLSPVEYIINHKMERAKEFLMDSRMNVSEVSRYLGYEDISYFNRLFKKHSGMSPGSLQK